MTTEELKKTIEEYGRDIYSFCMYLTRNEDDAEELYQDIWLVACENISKMNQAGNIKSYLLSVAVNRWNNYRRKVAWRKRILPVGEYDENQMEYQYIEEQDGLSSFLLSEKRQYVRTCVNHLSEKYKMPILLFYMEGLSVSEISRVLKIPEGTVKSRLSNARKKLKKELEDYLYE